MSFEKISTTYYSGISVSICLFELMSTEDNRILDKIMKAKCSGKGFGFDGTTERNLGKVDARNITIFDLQKQ